MHAYRVKWSSGIVVLSDLFILGVLTVSREEWESMSREQVDVSDILFFNMSERERERERERARERFCRRNESCGK